VDRRTVLKIIAASSLAGCSGDLLGNQNKRVVVVGAGIIGASIAYHLAKAGAQVTIIDKSGPASHASRGTFAWINATWAKQPRNYHRFNQSSVSSWHEWQQNLGIPVKWGGSLEWFDSDDRQRKLAAHISEQISWGEPARIVPAEELLALEPQVDFAGTPSAAFSPNDGAVDPVLATQMLLKAAQQYGVKVKFPCTLEGIRFSDNRVSGVDTSQGKLSADYVVLATGAEPMIGQLFAGLPIPQRTRPGIIGITKPLAPLLNRIVVAPGIHMHQRDDGRIVLGEQSDAPLGHSDDNRLASRPNNFPHPTIAAEHASRMLAIAIKYLPAIEGAEMEHMYIGWRPLPLDGHPVIGSSPVHPNVYLAIMHSGVSLAPLVGQLTAQELLNDTRLELLAEYRPEREFKLVTRY
jgi:glycine/D-amino acid oxidase-like deaminating enzyme